MRGHGGEAALLGEGVLQTVEGTVHGLHQRQHLLGHGPIVEAPRAAGLQRRGLARDGGQRGEAPPDGEHGEKDTHHRHDGDQRPQLDLELARHPVEIVPPFGRTAPGHDADDRAVVEGDVVDEPVFVLRRLDPAEHEEARWPGTDGIDAGRVAAVVIEREQHPPVPAVVDLEMQRVDLAEPVDQRTVGFDDEGRPAVLAHHHAFHELTGDVVELVFELHGFQQRVGQGRHAGTEKGHQSEAQGERPDQ